MLDALSTHIMDHTNVGYHSVQVKSNCIIKACYITRVAITSKTYFYW